MEEFRTELGCKGRRHHLSRAHAHSHSGCSLVEGVMHLLFD
jgi:hypothetical protein